MSAEAQRRYRDRRRGGPPRELVPCGTPGSRAPIRRHERAGEPLCSACLEVRRELNAAAYQRRRS